MERMEGLIEDCVDSSGIDEEYEFNAPQFYDFTRQECDSEIEESDRWFEVAGGYPPSPFIVKLNLEKILSPAMPPKSPNAKCSNNKKKKKSVSSCSDSGRSQGVSTSKKDAKGKNRVMQDNAKAKSDEKVFQEKSSTFMKPTASHLAKQKNVHNSHSGHICTRFQKISAKLEQKGLQSPTRFDSLETKRQKLETGYIRKAAQLKHQFPLMHKSTKQVTIPKEPELETMLRAQRRGSKSSCASSGSDKQKHKGCDSKALPLNKKIFQAPSVPLPEKSSPQQPEFRAFHLKTTQRANRQPSAKVYPSQTDMEVIPDAKEKATTLREHQSSAGDAQIESPPTEQLSELSLRANDTKNSSDSDRHASAKASGKARRSPAKPNQCGDHMRAHESELWSSMTRSLRIS